MRQRDTARTAVALCLVLRETCRHGRAWTRPGPGDCPCLAWRERTAKPRRPVLLCPGHAAGLLLPRQPPRRGQGIAVVPCPARGARGTGQRRTRTVLPAAGVGEGDLLRLAGDFPCPAGS